MRSRMDDTEIFVFYMTFDGVSDVIDFRGKNTAEKIEAEFCKAKRKYEGYSKIAEKTQEKEQLKQVAANYDGLLKNDFASKMMVQAKEKPDGLIALTIRFGKKQAQKRIFSQMMDEHYEELQKRTVFMRKCCTFGERQRKTKIRGVLGSQSLLKRDDIDTLRSR
jgi:hypothetical protein